MSPQVPVEYGLFLFPPIGGGNKGTGSPSGYSTCSWEQLGTGWEQGNRNQCRAKTKAGHRCRGTAQLQGLCTQHVRRAWKAAHERYGRPSVAEVVDTIHRLYPPERKESHD